MIVRAPLGESLPARGHGGSAFGPCAWRRRHQSLRAARTSQVACKWRPPTIQSVGRDARGDTALTDRRTRRATGGTAPFDASRLSHGATESIMADPCDQPSWPSSSSPRTTWPSPSGRSRRAPSSRTRSARIEVRQDIRPGHKVARQRAARGRSGAPLRAGDRLRHRGHRRRRPRPHPEPRRSATSSASTRSAPTCARSRTTRPTRCATSTATGARTAASGRATTWRSSRA